MGKWLEKEKNMKKHVCNEIINSLWRQLVISDSSSDSVILEKFKNIKFALGWLEVKNSMYVNSEIADALDNAIKNRDFDEFKKVFSGAPYETLSAIKMHEKLSLDMQSNFVPTFSDKDIDDFKEYLQETGISASISIKSKEKSYLISSDNLAKKDNIFAMHSIGKVFTGILVMRMIRDGVLSEEDLDKPVDLKSDILEQLPKAVCDRLSDVTLRQLMLHESGLGDYMTKQAAEVESALLKGLDPERVEVSNDLLKYADDELSPLGQFRYSNLGILLVGFAIEKKFNDKFELDKGIDEIIGDFAMKDVGMKVFERHMPINGVFNTKEQRFNNPEVKADDEFLYKFIESRFGSPAGGYCSTTEDLQKFGEWIQNECYRDPEFRRLIETHGGEFYNKSQTAVSHAGLHADSAHFYASLKKGDDTVISVMSDMGGMTSSNLVDTIILQTGWFKHSENKFEEKLGSSTSDVFMRLDIKEECDYNLFVREKIPEFKYPKISIEKSNLPTIDENAELDDHTINDELGKLAPGKKYKF